MILSLLLTVAVATSPLPASYSDTDEASLSLENKSLLRCAAAFALVARSQEAGEESSHKWPELGERGREFFVRALAQVMDETGYDREGITRAAGAQAREIQQSGDLDKIMPVCLVMLENSGA